MALHGSRLPGISRSDRGRFLPLPDHLYLAHLVALPLDDRCRSDARSCKHGGRPTGVSRKKEDTLLWVSSMKATMKYYHFFSQSRLYCRYRNLTGSAVKYGSRTVTAGRESHPAPRISFYSVVYYMPLYVLFQGIFHINRRFNFFTNFIPEGYYNVYKVFPSQGVSHESLFSFCKHAPPLRL